jgi:hypothetical protein
MVLSAKREYERADWYLRLVRKRHIRNLVAHLGLLQNAIMMQNEQRINTYLRQLAGSFRVWEIEHYFAERAKGYLYIHETLVPIKDRIILPYLAGFIEEQSQIMGNGANK